MIFLLDAYTDFFYQSMQPYLYGRESIVTNFNFKKHRLFKQKNY